LGYNWAKRKKTEKNYFSTKQKYKSLHYFVYKVKKICLNIIAIISKKSNISKGLEKNTAEKKLYLFTY